MVIQAVAIEDYYPRLRLPLLWSYSEAQGSMFDFCIPLMLNYHSRISVNNLSIPSTIAVDPEFGSHSDTHYYPNWHHEKEHHVAHTHCPPSGDVTQLDVSVVIVDYLLCGFSEDLVFLIPDTCLVG